MSVFDFDILIDALKLNGLSESLLLTAVLNMSVTGSVVILFVLLARLVLRKAPKVFSYALWAVVLFRLLCPVSVTANFSLLGLFDTTAVENTPHTTAVEYIPYDALHIPETGVQQVPAGVNQEGNSSFPQGHAALEARLLEGAPDVASFVWLTGMAVMLIYSAVSYILLRRKLIGAVALRDNIYLADGIGSPFVLGLIRPRVYLPSALPEQEQGYIILHEQHHIRRGDHMLKALAFTALCIHWFNPLVWAAFVLSSKDMEMSCDEAVVKKLGEGIRTDYSASLLSLATGRRIIAGTPLAFGEGDPKSRIKNMLSWKKPRTRIVFAAAIVCVTVIIFCAANPQSIEENPTETEPPEIETGNQPDVTPAKSKKEMLHDTAATGSLAEDASYYLELAAGDSFRDMDPGRLAEILSEYGDLLNEYALIARESTDGKAAYIVGQFTGESAQSPLYGMYSIELSAAEEEVFQFLYSEENSETVEAVWAANRTDFPPSAGYRIDNSRVLWSSNGETVLIQPKDVELLMDVPYNRYMYTPNGREYIADAVSRGIDMCGKTDTCLYVYLISERFGEIAERIALTEAEAQAILAEKRVKITEGLGFSASLHIDGQTTYYNEREGIPQTVLDLAVERCDYRFGDPGMITDTIREARLECDWLEAPLYAKTENLLRLREILKNAEHGYVGACGYGAKLTLTFTGGEKLTVFKGCDGCDTIVFGSYGGYFLGNEENTEFWEIFGLDPESKLPLDNAPVSDEG